jgi:hypothetical protein
MGVSEPLAEWYARKAAYDAHEADATQSRSAFGF